MTKTAAIPNTSIHKSMYLLVSMISAAVLITPILVIGQEATSSVDQVQSNLSMGAIVFWLGLIFWPLVMRRK